MKYDIYNKNISKLEAKSYNTEQKEKTDYIR